MDMVRNVIVLGGSGMLSGVSLRFLEEPSCQVFVVGRTRSKLENLVSQAGESRDRIIPLALDYTDIGRLRHWVAHSQLLYGPLDVVIAWLHGDEYAIMSALADEVKAYRDMPWRLIHVLGSRHAKRAYERPELPVACQYQEVILGFKVEDGRSRWLTHAEIQAGVWEALQHTGQTRTVCGMLEPWEKLPKS